MQDIQKDSLADKDGKLQIGDQIVSINGTDVKKSKFMEANRVLRSAKDKVILTVPVVFRSPYKKTSYLNKQFFC